MTHIYEIVKRISEMTKEEVEVKGESIIFGTGKVRPHIRYNIGIEEDIEEYGIDEVARELLKAFEVALKNKPEIDPETIYSWEESKEKLRVMMMVNSEESERNILGTKPLAYRVKSKELEEY